MGNTKISSLPIATELQGDELVVVVQNSITKQSTVNDVLGSENVRNVKISMTAAQIRNLGTSPIEAIPAPGVGKYIRLLKVDWNYMWGTVEFVTQFYYIGTVTKGDIIEAPFYYYLDENLLKSSDGLDHNIQWYPNEAMIINTAGDDSAVGDSTMDVYISYQIITL